MDQWLANLSESSSLHRKRSIECSSLFWTLPARLPGPEASEDIFKFLSGFQARRARETPVRGGLVSTWCACVDMTPISSRIHTHTDNREVSVQVTQLEPLDLASWSHALTLKRVVHPLGGC